MLDFSDKTKKAALYGTSWFGASVLVYGLVPVQLPLGPFELGMVAGLAGAYKGYTGTGPSA